MGNEKRVLVVDDDEATVALLRKILIAEQWQVETASSGRQALAKICPGNYDLIISDLNMPDVNGVELYQAAIQADPRLARRFVFVSGYADSCSVKAFLLDSGCPGIRKPIRLEEFRRVVRAIAEAKPISATGLPAPWFTPDSQYLYSGEITGRHTLLSLLNRIYAARLTGVLHMMMGRVEKRLYFNLGNLIFAASNLPDEGLGELMLRGGALTQSQFAQATARMEQGVQFGAALAELGICDEAQVAEWVRRQITHIATSIFESSAGRYYFFDSFEESTAPEVGVPLPMGRLILTAVRQPPHGSTSVTTGGGTARPFDSAQGRPGGQGNDLPLEELARDENLRVDLSPDPLICFQDVELDDDERGLLASVTRPMQAIDLMKASGIPAPRAVRALYALLALGMFIAVAAEAQPAPADSAPAAAATRLAAAVRPAAAGSPQAERAPAAALPAAAAAAPDLAGFEREIKRLLDLAETGTYYQLLDATPNSPQSEIKHNFYKMARTFHPDRHMGRSEWIGSLQKLMDTLALAYKTLSDEQLRSSYDQRLAESGAFALGRSKTEKQQTAEECLELAMERLRAKNYAGAILWLRKCVETAPQTAKYRVMLARSLAAVPQYRREAIEQFEKAIELDPWNTSAYLQLGELFEEMRLPWRARPLYEKILGIDPEHSKARERLRQLAAPAGKKDGKDSTLIGRLFRKLR
jgi:CheY-like chemotaxis protein/curved DNA-binding protein CbpA